MYIERKTLLQAVESDPSVEDRDRPRSDGSALEPGDKSGTEMNGEGPGTARRYVGSWCGMLVTLSWR
jgi:hypothetical protein